MSKQGETQRSQAILRSRHKEEVNELYLLVLKHWPEMELPDVDGVEFIRQKLQDIRDGELQITKEERR